MQQPPSLEAFDQSEQQKDTIRNLTRQLAKARASKDELVDAVYRAALDGIRGLSLPPVKEPPAEKRKRHSEVAVAVLGDWQLAKVTPTYNSEVCEERIERYADKVIQLANIQRADHPVTELRVWAIGDLVEGELIFSGQSHLIDASLYRQVTVDGPRILGNFLRRMLANFDRVHFTGVIGNHGALGGPVRREYSPEANADRMLYRIVQQIMASDKRITWTIPDGAGERHWYAIDTVGSYRALLCHGDQFRGGFAGFPFYGVAKKVWGWNAGAIEEPFDAVWFGHWHTPTMQTLNKIIARCNGSTESSNTYAAEQLAASGRPSQRLAFIHPERGVTAEYLVWLDG